MFGGEYPGGIFALPPDQHQADIVVRMQPAGGARCDREFTVVLTDADTGQPIVGPLGDTIEVGFYLPSALGYCP